MSILVSEHLSQPYQKSEPDQKIGELAIEKIVEREGIANCIEQTNLSIHEFELALLGLPHTINWFEDRCPIHG